MLTNWLEVDIGNEWRKYEDKTLLVDEIRVAFLKLQDIFWKNKPKNYKYYDIITCWFHDGNRDCGLLLDQVYLIRKGNMDINNLSWNTLYRLFHYLQWSYALMELTNLLDKEK